MAQPLAQEASAVGAEHCISNPMLKNLANLFRIIDFSTADFPLLTFEYQFPAGGHIDGDFSSNRDLEFENSER